MLVAAVAGQQSRRSRSRRIAWPAVYAAAMAGIHERYERLLEAGLALAAELALPATLQRIVELAAELTGARYGALGVLGRDGLITEFITTGVTAAERAAIGHIPVGRGILGVLIDDARPLRLHDIAEDPRSVGFPPNHPPMRSFLGAPVTARGRVFGNLYLTEKEAGLDFDDNDERTLTLLATQAGVAIENAYLYEQAQDRARRLEAVRAITTAILAGTDNAEILALVVGHARELVGADLATLALPAGTDQLVVEAADGLLAEQLQGTTFPAEGSVTGEVVRTGKAVVLADAAADDRTAQPIVRARLGPALFVPLAVRGRILGSLTVANASGGPPLRETEVQLVETFAEQAAVALEYARLQGKLQRLAVLEDRERIATELHDGAIQALFAVGMGLQGSALLAGDPELRGRLQDAVEELDRVIRDLRNYIFGLRPGILADRQLDQALHGLVEEFGQRTGVLAIAQVDPQAAAELTGRAGEVIQLAREALSNVSRHAQATTCRVSLYREGDGGVLEVDDDGRGFDPAQAAGAGQGLRNLRERAERLGGHTEIHSNPGQGTRIRVTIPR
jgi:signal transduction histidine kinase